MQYFPEQEFPPGFEWDPAKNVINTEKHTISLYEAVKIFEDPSLRIEDSTSPGHGESRFKCIGLMENQLVTVIATHRGERTRIISARSVRHDEDR